MNNKNNFSEGSFSVIGTPFDPFGNDAAPSAMNARIMPSQFNYPSMPLSFSLIRNVTSDEDDKTTNDFQ
ncbi:MAG: hypothetical protein IJ192_07520 [Clostridia bacterium]|nr:hypothetical protein [Clostridia bacterium]